MYGSQLLCRDLLFHCFPYMVGKANPKPGFKYKCTPSVKICVHNIMFSSNFGSKMEFKFWTHFH